MIAELVELERQGERVAVFAVNDPDEPFEHALLAELSAQVVYLPHRLLREPARVARALAPVLRSHKRALRNAIQATRSAPRLQRLRCPLYATVLRDEMRIEGIDHAHAYFARTAARLAGLARRLGGPTYSVNARVEDIYDARAPLDQLRENLACASFVATASFRSRDYLASLVADATRIHVVPNAIDLRHLPTPEERDPKAGLVLAFASPGEEQGLEDLVAACELLDHQGVALRLMIIGEARRGSVLEEASARSGPPTIVLGELPHEESLDLYRRAMVLCLPGVVAATADRDGLPTSVLEAMALGVPVVTTATSGLRELVLPEQTGLVVSPRNPQALAAAIGRLLADSRLADSLAKEGRRLIERRFSLERRVSDLRALFATASDLGATLGARSAN